MKHTEDPGLRSSRTALAGESHVPTTSRLAEIGAALPSRRHLSTRRSGTGGAWRRRRGPRGGGGGPTRRRHLEGVRRVGDYRARRRRRRRAVRVRPLPGCPPSNCCEHGIHQPAEDRSARSRRLPTGRGPVAINGGSSISSCAATTRSSRRAASRAAMGHYYFTDAQTGDEAEVESGFGYQRCHDGKVRIFLEDVARAIDRAENARVGVAVRASPRRAARGPSEATPPFRAAEGKRPSPTSALAEQARVPAREYVLCMPRRPGWPRSRAATTTSPPQRCSPRRPNASQPTPSDAVPLRRRARAAAPPRSSAPLAAPCTPRGRGRRARPPRDLAQHAAARRSSRRRRSTFPAAYWRARPLDVAGTVSRRASASNVVTENAARTRVPSECETDARPPRREPGIFCARWRRGEERPRSRRRRSRAADALIVAAFCARPRRDPERPARPRFLLVVDGRRAAVQVGSALAAMTQ